MARRSSSNMDCSSMEVRMSSSVLAFSIDSGMISGGSGCDDDENCNNEEDDGN